MNIEDDDCGYSLDCCEECMQMTNHLNGKCQKCRIKIERGEND